LEADRDDVVKRIQGASEPRFQSGTGSEVDLLAALASELIGAAAPRRPAPAIEQAARQLFGFAGLALLYTPMPNTPKGISLRCAPVRPSPGSTRTWPGA
jgi:hypothetical protein